MFKFHLQRIGFELNKHMLYTQYLPIVVYPLHEYIGFSACLGYIILYILNKSKPIQIYLYPCVSLQTCTLS